MFFWQEIVVVVRFYIESCLKKMDKTSWTYSKAKVRKNVFLTGNNYIKKSSCHGTLLKIMVVAKWVKSCLVSEKSCPFLYSDLLNKNGQDFLYLQLQESASGNINFSDRKLITLKTVFAK